MVLDKIKGLVVSYPNDRELICECVTQLLSAVECQRHAIKESIENEGPCSDSFMEEITQELGLPSQVSFGASSSTPPLVNSPSPADANTPSTRSPYNKQMVEPPPAPSSPMDVTNSENRQDTGEKHDNTSKQSLVPGGLPSLPNVQIASVGNYQP